VLNTHVLAVTAPVREGDERSVAAVQRIQRYAARMNRLLGDLVDVVSIDAGRLNIQRTPADARTLLVEAMDTFAPSAAEKGIAIVSLLGDAPLEASFDHDRLMQVVVNLITNALKFTPTGGTITVLAEQRAEDLHICVSDTGCGIDSAFSEAVFERFWQIGVNDRRGMGLGLYISRCIVEAHGGTIWLVSELGKGSELHLAIPRGVT
jgi:signal transduction histidine kinase